MLRASRIVKAGVAEPRKGMSYLRYTRPGSYTTYSLRQRYPTMQKMATDSAVGDRLFYIWVKDWMGDPAGYNYIWCTVGSLAASFIAMARLLWFDPDVQHRRENMHMAICDKKRLHSYALPFFNHRLRNWSCRYNWMFCGADHDWSHKIYTGTRPDRAHALRRPFFWSAVHWYCFPYVIDDPLYTSSSVHNFNRIYDECGYKKLHNPEEEVEEE